MESLKHEPVIYLLSGIGADERLFQFLTINAKSIVPVKWIKPLPKETLAEYAVRISAQIDTSKPVILIGVSFGGIMSMELNKIIKVEKTIIISSVKTPDEFPFYFNWARRTGFYKLIPVGMDKKAFPLLKFIFGASKKEIFEVLKAVVLDSDNDLVKWTIREVLYWKNSSIPQNITHIHGTADLIFPIRFVKNVIKIKGGTHVMIAERAEEVSKIINNSL